MLGCSQRGGTEKKCHEICQWTGPPPLSCPVSATLGGAPDKTPGGAPARTLGGAPARALGGAPARTLGGAPDKTPGGAPAKTTGGAPAKSPDGAPAKTLGGAPAKTLGGGPAKTLGGAPARTPGGAPAKTLGGAPARTPEAESDCSDDLTAAYDMCNSTSEMIRETSDGKVEGKKIQNDQKENCCCILTILIAGEDIKKALSNELSP